MGMSYENVLTELKQRFNFYGSFYPTLNHVPRYVEISPAVMVKQQMNFRKVNTKIKQFGLKDKLNQELKARMMKSSRKASSIPECQKLTVNSNSYNEVRTRSKKKSWHKDKIQELEQRVRHREVVKE